MNFVLIGAAGYIAPRHLEAIKATGNKLIAVLDPHDSVGIIDRYFPAAAYFREFERLDRYVEKLRHGPDAYHVDCVSICSPNYLHDAHIRAALRWGASAICEKPIVINPWNLDALLELEAKSEGRVHPVLQLRLHPAVQGLRGRLQAEKEGHRHQVSIRYITPRGSWYQYSWKGDIEKSGGLAMNIGVHFFDMLIWLFGGVQANTVAGVSPTYIGGELALERADVRWFLSVDRNDLPSTVSDAGNSASRSIQIDGEEIDFTKGFADLHTQVYEEALAGRWFGMQDALPAIELVHDIREKAIGIL